MLGAISLAGDFPLPPTLIASYSLINKYSRIDTVGFR